MITPNNPAILYSPYNWDVAAARAKTINAGAYFRLMITGSPAAVVLNFDMSGLAGPVPKIAYDIDGAAVTVDLAAAITVPLPAVNTWGTHLLTVTVEATTETVDRWQEQKTAVKFTGITTDGAAAPLPPRPVRVLVLGDSITEGVRTLNATAPTDTARNSARNSWAYHLGPLLDAETGIVGFGGTGLARAGSGGAPAAAGYWNTQWAGGPGRGITAAPPNFVVINLGTNDGTTSITAPYSALLGALLAAAPEAVILCLTPFIGTHGREIAAAAAAVDPARCVPVDTAGWWDPADATDALHPYGYTAPDLARRVANAVAAVSPNTASNYFVFNRTNQPVPVTAVTIN